MNEIFLLYVFLGVVSLVKAVTILVNINEKKNE
jgi:hypothetical protein